MRNEHAAARSERKSFDVVILRSIFGRPVHRQRRRCGVANCQTADFLAGGNIRLDQRRRHAERTGNVIEAMRRIIGRQILVRIDTQIQHVFDYIRVLCTVQTVQPGRRRVCHRRSIEFVFKPGIEPFVCGRLRRFIFAGGIMPARNLRTISSQVFASFATCARSN